MKQIFKHCRPIFYSATLKKVVKLSEIIVACIDLSTKFFAVTIAILCFVYSKKMMRTHLNTYVIREE